MTRDQLWEAFHRACEDAEDDPELLAKLHALGLAMAMAELKQFLTAAHLADVYVRKARLPDMPSA